MQIRYGLPQVFPLCLLGTSMPESCVSTRRKLGEVRTLHEPCCCAQAHLFIIRRLSLFQGLLLRRTPGHKAVHASAALCCRAFMLAHVRNAARPPALERKSWELKRLTCSCCRMGVRRLCTWSAAAKRSNGQTLLPNSSGTSSSWVKFPQGQNVPLPRLKS